MTMLARPAFQVTHILRYLQQAPQLAVQQASQLWNMNLLNRGFCVTAANIDKSNGSLPRRAMLYVPGSDERKLAKLSSLSVDCAVMDCEDGVAINRKANFLSDEFAVAKARKSHGVIITEAARQIICKMLDRLQAPNIRDLAVRVNSVVSGLAEEDLKTILKALRLPDTLMLPKVDCVGHIQWFGDKLQLALEGRELTSKLRLVIFIESALGLLHLPAICEEGLWHAQNAPFALEGVVFGSDDFCADIGATRTESATELLYARQKIITTVKAYGLQAIDLVYINYKDLESLERQSIEGAQMGFTGKQVIHPSQIPVVQQAFSPSPERVEWAKELIKAFDEHQQLGKINSHWITNSGLCKVVPETMHFASQKTDAITFPADLLERFLTQDECWVHRFEPETKRQSMQWKHPSSPPSKEVQGCLIGSEDDGIRLLGCKRHCNFIFIQTKNL